MASKRQKRRKSCTGKIRYDMPEQAKAAAVALKRDKGQRKVHAYYCPFCNSWHIGRMKL